MNYTCKRNVMGWQLYDVEGATEAADKINRILSEKVNAALARIEADPDLSEKKLARRIENEMCPVLEELSDFGAGDGEPYQVLLHELEKAFRLDPYELD